MKWTLKRSAELLPKKVNFPVGCPDISRGIQIVSKWFELISICWSTFCNARGNNGANGAGDLLLSGEVVPDPPDEEIDQEEEDDEEACVSLLCGKGAAFYLEN